MSRNIVAWFPHIALTWAAIAVSCGESYAAVTTAPVSERPVYCMIGKDRIAVMRDIWRIEDDLRELDEAARAADAGQ